MRTTLALAFGLALVLGSTAACKNKDYEKCLKDADDYEKQKVECLAMTDKAQQEACTSKNEVHKISRADCEASYK